MYGSCVNGLCSRQSSDLDLTIIYDDFEYNHEEFLYQVNLVVKKYGGINQKTAGITNENRYELKLKPTKMSAGHLLQYHDNELDMKIDIMMNKTSELYHSNMLLQYAMIDYNFLKIAHFLKAWNNEIAKGKNHWNVRLNNFSIYLMLIAFMQREKLLPNL